MKYVLLAFLCLAAASESHTLDEVTQMVTRGLTLNDRLIIKVKEGKRLNTLFPTATVKPLFQRGREVYRSERRKLEHLRGEALPHLEDYLQARFQAPLDKRGAVAVLEAIYQDRATEFAYFEPISENAGFVTETALPESYSSVGDLEPKQFYLDPSPQGVNARIAWERTGGAGEGVRVIDIEGGWNISHEEFLAPFFKILGSQEANHGTAVWGEVAAKRDGKGVTGIAYDSQFGVARYVDPGTYDTAAAKLVAGDILIIERHHPGPDAGKWTAVEYWQATFDVFKVITAKGINVIAAAGNGNSNFDNPVYKGAYDLKVRDSGAILVGAGAPPTTAAHLTRLDFSNYGTRVDVMGYGRDVTTTGYGSLFNGGKNATYTATFSGTSSATPIVSGVVASFIGMAKARGWLPTPLEIRQYLRDSGAPQKGKVAERIGNLPNLQELIQKHLP